MLDEYGLELQPWSSFKNTNYLIMSFRGRAASYRAEGTCADDGTYKPATVDFGEDNHIGE